ncbi:nucleoside hydrolase [Mycobacterium sp. BMJ-28]
MLNSDPRPIFLDCDTGIDDALALAYLLASSAVDLVGVGTVSGNTSAAQAGQNTLDLLAVAGRLDVPVAIGGHDWLTQPFDGGSPSVHGHNGIGDVELPRAPHGPANVDAAELLIQLSDEYHGTLHVLAIGPLTNLAHALDRQPGLPSRVASVTVMGGAALVPGNVTPVAEANIWHDPDAAQRVISADWDVNLVPLDVTMENTFHDEHQRLLSDSDNPLAGHVGEMLDYYFGFYQSVYGRRCCALHDPLAAAIAAGNINPTVAPAVPIEVDTTHGPGRGQTICDMRGQRRGDGDHLGVRTRITLATDAGVAPHLIETLTGPRQTRQPL